MVFVSFSKASCYRKPWSCFSLVIQKWQLDTMPSCQLQMLGVFYSFFVGFFFCAARSKLHRFAISLLSNCYLTKALLQISYLPSCTETPKFSNIEAQGLELCCEFATTHCIRVTPIQTVKWPFPFFCLGFREPSAACQWSLTMGLLWVHVTAITPTAIPIAVFIFAVSSATGLSILSIPGML